MSSAWCKHEGKNVLLVEGDNDCHVVLALCQAYSLPETFGIYACGSDDKVLKRLNALILAPDRPDVIGVVLDADDPAGTSSVARRWQQVQRKLNNHQEYALPSSPETNGTVIPAPEDLPSLGFWLMPDNERAGMLEDFLSDMVDDEPLRYAAECVEGAKDRGHATFKPVHLSKAILHTYLAWQNKPGQPLGRAITQKALRPHTSIADAFADWLRLVFGD